MSRFGLTAIALLLAAITGSETLAQGQYRDEYGNGDDRAPRGGITVFADDDFRGRSLHIDGPIARLGPTGMEDKISSIGVDGGTWLVCTDDDFRGRCVTIDRSIGRLNRIGMEDNISSIRPVRGGRRWR